MTLHSCILFTNVITIISLFIIYIKWEIIQQKILDLLKAKIGLHSIESIQFSIDSRRRLKIHISNVELRKLNPKPSAKDSPQNQRFNQLVASKPFNAVLKCIQNTPVHFFIASLVKHVNLRIDCILFKWEDKELQIGHIDFSSKLTSKEGPDTDNQLFQKIFAIQCQFGPTSLKLNDKSVVDMTTISSISSSFHFHARQCLLKDLDLDIQLGKTILDINTMVSLIQSRESRHQNNTETEQMSLLALEDIISAINFKIQSLHFNYVVNKEIVTNFDICKISLFFALLDGRPTCQFNTETISYFLAHHRLLLVPAMELNVSLLDGEGQSIEVLPLTDIASIVWTIESPELQLPFQSKIIQETLKYMHANKSSKTAPVEPLSQKVISNLPMCHLAIILNSPKFMITEVASLHGSMSSQSLIIRLSGEYISRGRNSTYDDVSSSFSSSSASHLDNLFAREEYKWLSHTPDRKRPTRSTKRHTIQQFIGRASRQKQILQKANTHEKWNYKLSLKAIIQRASLGYDTENDTEDFIRLKHVVVIAKSNMNVVQEGGRYDVVFALGNSIHSEAAIDKPMICLCHQNTIMSASVFWLKSIPQAMKTQYLFIFEKEKKEETPQELSYGLKLLLKILSFSLDVTEGSIVAWSLDAKHQKPVKVPEGHIDNTPTSNICARLILDTQKFTFVYEGTELISDKSQWRSRCHLEKLYIHQASTSLQDTTKVKELLEKDEKQHLILWISQLNFATSFSSKNSVQFTAKVKKIGVAYSIRNHYVCLLSIRSLMALKEQLKSSSTTNTAEKKAVSFSVDLNVGRTDIQIGLPFDKKLYLRLDEFSTKKLENQTNPVSAQFRNIMLLGTSPLHKNKWEQLVELDQLQATPDIKPVFEDSQIDLNARKIFVTIPYEFVFSAVIDSIIGLVKAVKELHGRILKEDAHFTYFGPNMKNEPIVIPHIRLKTKLVSIYFDDDPFESKLRKIFRTGLAEQQRRIAYENALDAKVYDMMTTTYPDSSSVSIKSQQQQQSQQTNLDTIIEPDSDTKASSTSPEHIDIKPQIVEAHKSLLEYFSEFWIRHINKTNSNEAQFYNELFNLENYRNLDTADAIDRLLDDGDSRRHGRFLYSKTFIIDIIPRPTSPPLAGFSAQFTKVSFRRADFSVNDTRNFIHHTGGGVPFDSNFSIIIPFHLSIKAGKTWIKARDYPIPLLYIPPLVTQANQQRTSRTSWTLEGNYVAGDELGDSGGSRIIPVTILPQKPEMPGYCLSAVRTASPLKFYSVIDYKILTQDMSLICWSVSYSPVIQDILRVLDTLTAAQVDPSPRIGFWDKVRFMIHSRIKIHFTGGGDLSFVVKGTRDPYQLKGRGAGLAKVWSNNVVWLLGETNPQKEFMQIISENYALGVPDLIRGGYVPDIPNIYASKFIVENVTHHRFLKVVLKLTDGIRMGIGLSYERLVCDLNQSNVCFHCKNQNLHIIDRCRSQEFMPHYKVLFQSVETANKYHNPEHYDAFRGFRSDFIHLSFSIIKLENESSNKESPDFSKDDPYFDLLGMTSHNSMHLSTCFLEHFLEWYRMFGSPISLPIRHGKLFPTDEPKAKSFGELLNTIKYKIVVDPLAIGMFFTDMDTYLNIKGGGSAGLKARVNSFRVDLHQRRELVLASSNCLLKEANAKTEINLHEADIQLTDIDLRIIKAIYYKNINHGDHHSSNRSATTKSYSKSISDTTSIPLSDNHTDASSSFSAEDSNSSFQWIDSKDFVILDSVGRQLLHYSKTEVLPFAYSPLFQLVKQIDEIDVENREYLRKTHDCIFGQGMESQNFQRAYMDRRANELSKVIEDHDKQLDIIINAIENYKSDPKELQAEYNILLKKIDFLQRRRYMLHGYLAQLILETELNKNRSDCDRDSPLTSNSSICRRDEISRWQMLMGHFKTRYFIHYPQIILNSSVSEALHYLGDIYNTRSVQNFNLSARCLQFLEELVETAEKQKNRKSEAPNQSGEKTQSYNNKNINQFDDDDDDRKSTDDLIKKLLSERSTNFVAYNEKEEHKSKNNTESTTNTNHAYEGIHVSEDSQNFDDPDFQYQSIPDFYKMTSDFLIDLIHPQVVFQSDKGQDHLILLTNERIHIKSLNIMDNSQGVCTADKDVNQVKKRIVASFDNAQLLIAKKIEEIESYSSLAQNCYGQFQEKHWAVWTQPELLWSYQDVDFFENFQRVSTQLTGSLQVDLFNHLRIKINKHHNLRETPFEDRTNTTQLHLPQVKITLNSEQAHILYYTLTDLALGNQKSPKKQLKNNKLRDVMLAAERSDLAETVEQVRVLQNRSRNLLSFYRRFKSEFSHLDTADKKEFLKNKRRMRESLENLYLIVEAIRSIQMYRRDIHVENTDDATRFIFTSDEIVWEAVLDYSTQSSLFKCILNNTNYILVNKPNGSSQNTIEIDRMQIKNTTDSPIFNNVLDGYLEPSSPIGTDYSRYKMIRGTLDTLPPVGGIPIVHHLEIILSPLNIQLSRPFWELGMDYFFPKTEQAIERSLDGQIQLDSDYPMVDDDDYISNEEFDDKTSIAEYQLKDNEYGNHKHDNDGRSIRSTKREGSFISLDSLTKKVKQTMSRKRKIKEDELTVMKTRSSTNRTYIFVRIPSAKHCISIQPHHNPIYNIYNFIFKQPNLEYRNVTWSMAEMTERISKEFWLALIRQSPALIKQKLLANNKDNIVNLPSVPQAVTLTKKKSRQVLPPKALKPDLIESTFVFDKHDTTDDEKPSTSYNTDEDYDEDTYSHYHEDTKSLYSNAPDDDQDRLVELQVATRIDSFNVDDSLSSIYMKKYKKKETSDIIEKGRILFGERYNGPTF